MGRAMTASAAIDKAGGPPDHQKTRASPLVVWLERVEARALLVSHGDMDLQTAVDGLQEVAAAQGLVKALGQDQIQQLMAESFARL
jgi:hypothetical protein